jgi:hypothetical protein
VRVRTHRESGSGRRWRGGGRIGILVERASGETAIVRQRKQT